MALAAPPLNDRKRVKVYELKNNDWYDRGTGFCAGQVISAEEARIFVQSEDDPQRTLLETRISKDDGYQKQQDTLIVWTESNGVDMALSFQEADGCGAIWDFVSDVQQRLVALAPEVENIMRAASATPPGRDNLAKFIMNPDSLYIPKLLPLVETAEDMEDLADLHKLCNIMKTLILLNDTAIIEFVVSDGAILGVVGALEYDPDFPSHKANHRQYLADESKFKEVVKIENPDIKKKIHYTYRLQYLKDVVLARILDDPTFSVLNSLIFFHQVDIVNHLQSNSQFLTELFGIFRPQETSQQRKKDAVLFIQNCCAVAKNIQAQSRAQLFQNFINGGLFNVVTFALRHHDAAVRVAGTDILVALIDHDPIMMRTYIFKAINEKSKPLTDTLIELLLVEVDLGVKAQMADAIKVLLDPTANSASMEMLNRTNGDFLAKVRGSPSGGPQTETFIQNFYDDSAKKLFQPLKDLERRQTSALKWFRTCIGLQDEFHNRQIIQHKLFEPILDIVYETMPRDNLLNSACLELFEFIKRENVKQLVVHLVENYRERLMAITYVNVFHSLVQRYEQMQAGYNPVGEDASFSTQATDTPNKGNVNGAQRWQGLKDADAEEEAYFNTSDGEDEEDVALPTTAMPKSTMNGASPIRPLVSYPDDDDDAMDVLTASPSAPVTNQENTDPKALPDGTDTDSARGRDRTPVPLGEYPGTRSPPERLSEKRRREEDDLDDLEKMASSSVKRRNSVGSVTSTRSATPEKTATTQTLRRKGSLRNKDGSHKGPGAGSISIALQSSPAPKGDDAG
ncbi:Platinum sensitivity protein [Taxawa tesnikishii (nom. ined.)]|nr:Platinum sensitivity protein [Dothideales sp. JES 119]